MNRLALIPLLLILSGCVSSQISSYKKAMTEPVEVWEDKVSIVDDSMETRVKFTTQPAIYDLKNSFTGEAMDAFLRGFMDKQTGLAYIHGYLFLSMRNHSWPEPYQINHGVPLQTYKLDTIGRDVDCTNHDIWGDKCAYQYHVTFDIPMSEFERLEAANYTLDDMANKLWMFRVKFGDYEDFNHGISVQEMLAIYHVMQENGAFF